MIEIHLGEEFKIPSVNSSKNGNIILRFPIDMRIDDALSLCQDELLKNLKQAFCKLFGDREFPREYEFTDGLVVIKPRQSNDLLNS